jgi:hypothetical protein
MPMKALLFVCAMALPGCATIVSHQEDQLTAAGFTAEPADTPERQTMLTSLPAQQFVRGLQGATYTYADPLVCHCLYVGSRQAYANYKRLVRARTAQQATTGSSGYNNYSPRPQPPMR